MATTTRIDKRIERSLHAVTAETDDLPTVAAEWASLSDGERAAVSLDWDHLMADYLTELDEYYRSGEMTLIQQVRYRELLRKLKEALPIITRLNFYPPPVSLEP
ncbi:MAG: hypothetical protein HY331_16190 [Chloroflexi bacterium]|nr:hypothetical protein [Chloroflexota bacterium]